MITSKPNVIDGSDKVIKIEGRYNGLPYRGPLIYLKEDDPVEKQPVLHRDLKVARFDTSNEEDIKKYMEICQSITDGTAQLSMEKIEYVPEKANWVILLRWIELWYGEPEIYE